MEDKEAARGGLTRAQKALRRQGSVPNMGPPGFYDMSWISACWCRLSRNGWWLLAIVPFVFVVGVVVKYNVPVPFLDHWDLVPMLEKSYQGNLSFNDFWELHNEHRSLFHRLIFLGLARLTDWDIRYELAASILLALGIFGVLVWQVRRTAQDLGRPELRWAVPATSVIIFSMSQYQDWLWGIPFCIFLSVLAVVSSIVLLASQPFQWTRFVAATLLGIVASYSFGNGGLVWPIGLVMLSVVTAGKKERKPSLIIWAVVGALTMGFYFYHYEKPEEHPALTLLFQHPIEYAGYVLKFLGNICAEYPGTNIGLDAACAVVYGLGATVALGWASRVLLRNKLVQLSALLPYLCLGLYSVASALLIGIGRLGLGSDQALMSRYCALSAPLWFSLVIALILLVTSNPRQAESQTGGEVLEKERKAARWLLQAATILLVLGSALALDGAQRMSRALAYAEARLLSLAANPSGEIDYRALGFLHPRPAVILQYYPFLKQHRLSVFRDQESVGQNRKAN